MHDARLRGAAAVLALGALLAGCAAPATEPSAAPTATDAPAATPTATAAPTASADPMADWQLIQPESGRAQFRIPADWSADVTFAEQDGEPIDGVTVRRPDGQPQLTFSQAPGDVGGICTVEGSDGVSTPMLPDSELLDTAPLALGDGSADAEAVAFGAVAVELEDGRWIFGMGITAEEWLQEPLGCPFYFITTGPAPEGEPGGIMTFATESQLSGMGDAAIWIVDSIEDARAYLETEEYATLKQILLSFEPRV
ncbi:hypothetical protein ACVWW9_001365 [Agrococcus sp. UYP33]